MTKSDSARERPNESTEQDLVLEPFETKIYNAK
jgi:hypothetical protein